MQRCGYRAEDARVGSGAPLLQRRVLIQNVERIAVDPPGSGAPPHRLLYTSLRASPREFRFGSEEDLEDLLVDKASITTTTVDADNFVAAAPAGATAAIVAVTRAPTAESHTTLRIKLTVRVQGHSDTEVNAYSSIKRHLLEQPAPRTQYSEPDARPHNTLAKVGKDRYQQAFEDYIDVHAQRLQRRGMLFGYDPSREPGHDADIIFGAQPLTFPRSDNDGLLNPIHAYPVRGTKVRSLSQDEYAAVTRIRAWYHRVDLDRERRQPVPQYPNIASASATTLGQIAQVQNLWNAFRTSYGSHLTAANAQNLANALPANTGPQNKTPMLVTFKTPFSLLHGLMVITGCLSQTAPEKDPVATSITPGTRDIVALLRSQHITRDQIAWFVSDIPDATLTQLFALAAGGQQTNQIMQAFNQVAPAGSVAGALGPSLQLETRRAKLDYAATESRKLREPTSVVDAIGKVDSYARALAAAGFLTAGEWRLLT